MVLNLMHLSWTFDHADNRKKDIIVLSEVSADGIDDPTITHQGLNFLLTLSSQKRKFA